MRDIEILYCADCKMARGCRRRIATGEQLLIIEAINLTYHGAYYTCEDCGYWITCESCDSIISEVPHHCRRLEPV